MTSFLNGGSLKRVNRVFNGQEDKAEAGVGTFIIFLVLVLLAAFATAAIINTFGGVEREERQVEIPSSDPGVIVVYDVPLGATEESYTRITGDSWSEPLPPPTNASYRWFIRSSGSSYAIMFDTDEYVPVSNETIPVTEWHQITGDREDRSFQIRPGGKDALIEAVLAFRDEG